MSIEGVLIVVGQRVIAGGPDPGSDPFNVSVSKGGNVSF